MKRRISSLLLAVCFAAIAFGCSGGDVKVSFDSEKPWSVREKCTYKVERIYVGGDENKVVASGTYTTELIDRGESSDITNIFTLTYNDEPETTSLDEHGKMLVNKGLTDSFTGKAQFDNNSLAPITASRVQNVAQRPLNDDPLPARVDNPSDGVAYSYTCDSAIKNYADPRGYTYEANYKENTAVYTTTIGSTSGNTRSYKNTEKTVKIDDNTRFDNEQLNYVVRALSSIAREGNATFYLSSIHDSYVRDTYIRYTMSMSCEKSFSSVDLDLPQVDFINTENQPLEKNETTGMISVQCVLANVSISSETPGPGIKFYITDPGLKVRSKNGSTETRKLIAKMVFTEYAVTSAKLAYQTVYTLIDYSNN